MTPEMIKAREIRIWQDREKQRLAAEKRHAFDEAVARQKLVRDAIDSAYGGARTVSGRIEVVADYDVKAIRLVAGGKMLHHVTIDVRPPAGDYRYCIDRLGARVYDSIPLLIDGLAEVLAPDLDLSEDDERPVYLTTAERAAAAEILSSFHPVRERHPEVDARKLVEKLRS